MRFVLPLALLGCSPEALKSLESPESMEPFLIDDVEEAFPERARSTGDALGRLTPNGPDLYGTPYPTAPLPVADALEDVAILWDDQEIQLVVWVPRSGLERTMAEHTWTQGDQGVRIPAGTRLEIAEEEATSSRIQLENEEISLDLWVADQALDEVWIDEQPDAWEPAEGRHRWTYAGIELLDGPLGEPIGLVKPWPHLEGAEPGDREAGQPVSIIEESRGHSRVQFWAGDLAVDAWVHDDDLFVGPSGWGVGGFGMSSGCGMRGYWPTLRGDARLYAEPNGTIVGRTLSGAGPALSGDPGAWRSFEVDTPWGTAELFVHPDDVL